MFRKILIGLFVLALLTLTSLYYLGKYTPAPPTGTQAKLKDSKPKQLGKEDLQKYYIAYKNPSVLYLRKTLNAYLANDITQVKIADSAIKEEIDGNSISGLDAFDKKYYQSKFVVLTINNAISGGTEMRIIFQDKPDRIFYAWVYQLSNGDYELRAFTSEEPDAERMKDITEEYKEYLSDKVHAL